MPRNHHDGASAFLPVPHPKMDRPTGRIAPSNSDGHLYHLFRPVSLANAVHFILPPATEPHPLEEVLIFPNRVIAAVCKVQLEPSLTTKTSHSIRGADMEDGSMWVKQVRQRTPQNSLITGRASSTAFIFPLGKQPRRALAITNQKILCLTLSICQAAAQ